MVDLEKILVTTYRETYLAKNLDMEEGYTSPDNGPKDIIGPAEPISLLEYAWSRR